jgi:hypothetical protein
MIFQSFFLFALALVSSFGPTADAKKTKADLEKVTSKVRTDIRSEPSLSLPSPYSVFPSLLRYSLMSPLMANLLDAW